MRDVPHQRIRAGNAPPLPYAVGIPPRHPWQVSCVGGISRLEPGRRPPTRVPPRAHLQPHRQLHHTSTPALHFPAPCGHPVGLTTQLPAFTPSCRASLTQSTCPTMHMSQHAYITALPRLSNHHAPAATVMQLCTAGPHRPADAAPLWRRCTPRPQPTSARSLCPWRDAPRSPPSSFTSSTPRRTRSP